MSVQSAKRNNRKVFMEHGPGLRYDYQTWIEARAPGWVLLGGLGGLGCGVMWFRDDGSYRRYPGWRSAPRVARREDFRFQGW